MNIGQDPEAAEYGEADEESKYAYCSQPPAPNRRSRRELTQTWKQSSSTEQNG